MMAALRQTSMMMLAQLLQGIVEVTSEADRAVQRLILDSRKVQHGDVFLACIGQTADGRHYIDQAIAQGAVAVLWDSDRTTVPIPLGWRVSPSGARIPCLAINNLSQMVGVLADRLYHAPSKSMYMVGITGTNGKTSSTQFIAQALAPDVKCGVIGTLGWGFADHLLESSHTTPDGITTQQWLADLYNRGAAAVAMEISSHALDQGRVNGVSLDCAVFTNITHDHLDYHKTIASYAQAKQKLFAWPTLRHAVMNVDDDYGREFLHAIPSGVKVLTYGLHTQHGKPDIYASNIRLDGNGLTFHVSTADGDGDVAAPLFGRFNVSNLLATLGVLLHYPMAFADALQRLSRIMPVTGRMQLLRAARHATVVVDYAHTPDALQQALTSLREHATGKLWCVFGCGGNRDQLKRPRMGEIAEQLADQVIITSDNPRFESPEAIIVQIQSGMRSPDAAVIQTDRRLAIRFALANADHDDIVLIAGKGHEHYQQIADKKLPFSDIEEVQQYWREVGDHGR